ncbi:MAG: tetratricopeptide repeat protein [Candidatus Kapabacteria bacterium]|nr:tetratricopeptide repeat protein [Ignavibacteria bacterium]MBP6510081.1 tetratricopeptide repeat protein [Candidatus Kapabacteria bacterium]MBK6418285.1 tetratricopeptide repeat protein [Ignavibacteria bacterium]MBK6761171.1 tetratricopeptide repeat protein [Ignavibacteria bacterium]MBK7032197.1 tetratricopeptide repeat protein [Ignavibacteria bacterium]
MVGSDEKNQLVSGTLDSELSLLLSRAVFRNDRSAKDRIEVLFSDHPDRTVNREVKDLLECFLLFSARRTRECIDRLLTIIREDQRQKSTDLWVVTMVLLIRAFQRDRRFKEAMALHDDWSPWSESLSLEEQVALHRHVGNTLSLMRRISESQEHLSKAYSLSVDLQSVEYSALIYVDLANITSDAGDTAKAITMYESSLHVLGKSKENAADCIIIRLNLASLYPSVGRDQDALREYDLLLEKPEVKQHPTLLYSVQLNRAISLKRLRRHDESLESYQSLLEMTRANSNDEFQLRALVGLADLLTILGTQSEAREMSMKAVALAETLGVEPLKYQAIANIAVIEHQEGNTGIAIDHILASFQWMTENGDLSHAIDYGRILAELYTVQDRYQDAFHVQRSCSELHRSMYEKEIERTIELASVRSRLDHERNAIRFRDEERNKILNAVLPPRVASRLMAGETHIADNMNDVTIMFADIVGFTKMASSMEPEHLVILLEDLFTEMDRVCAMFGCERLKTIGDSFMAICGASEYLPDHVERMCKAALYIVSGRATMPLDHSRLRIGIHAGPVVAGVMSGARLSYDVWGYTVNIASRIEENSQPGRILCSESVEHVLRNVSGFTFEKHKPLDIKGKGLLSTYWISSTSSTEEELDRSRL